MPALDAARIFRNLIQLNPARNYLIAFSGGMDSHVLMQLMASIRDNETDIRLRSIYIDHGLQAESGDWARHCAEIASQLQIPHQHIAVEIDRSSGQSLEALARQARYNALQESLEANENLLTAHHQNDQAETLLLQLLRGAGIKGLAAMPASAAFGKGCHLRPFLYLTRRELLRYAEQQQLDYIEDPSNADQQFDRNFLRHRILPKLQQRWPNHAQSLARSARHAAEAQQLQDYFLEREIAAFRGNTQHTLSIPELLTAPGFLQKALLRYWIAAQGFLLPSEQKLAHILSDVVNAQSDATPLLEWQGCQIRRYRQQLYIMAPPRPVDLAQSFSWSLQEKLLIDPPGITLEPQTLGDLGKILLRRKIPVTVRWRQGGERIRPQGQAHSRSVKKLLQEARIPPWQRDNIPLIYAADQLIQVVGIATIDTQDLADESP